MAEAVGMPQPVFYGTTLYPLLGLISSVTGAAWAIRVGVVASNALVFFTVLSAARAATRHTGISLAVAVSMVWSTHALTNLYNRAALPEYFGVGFLVASAAMAAMGFAQQSPKAKWPHIWLAGGLGVFAAGSHPPTALIAVGFWVLMLFTATMIALLNRWRLRALVGCVVAVSATCALALAPWIYATLKLGGELGVVGKYRKLSFTPNGCDAWVSRFSPVPYDPAMGATSRSQGETPYLEAPVVFGLLVLLGWMVVVLTQAWRQRMIALEAESRCALAFAAAASVWTAVTLGISLSPTVAGVFWFVAPYVQFATRFVSHANVGLFVAVLALGFAVTRTGLVAARRTQVCVVVATVFLIATVGVSVKLNHAAVVKESGGEPQFAWRGDREALVLPGKPDAAGDYAMTRRVRHLRPETARNAVKVTLPVGLKGKEFGKVGSTQVAMAEDGWVITNAVVFAWGALLVNDKRVDASSMAVHEARIAVHLPEGEHTLRWEWRPDWLWMILRRLGAVAAATLLVGMAVAGSYLIGSAISGRGLRG